MTDQPHDETAHDAPSDRREPETLEGRDRAIVIAFVSAPLVIGPVMAFVLSGRFEPVTFVAFTVLVAVMLRSAIWHLRAMTIAQPRAALYLERRDATSNTSFIAGLLIGLAIYDILPLPAGPFWSAQQPRASFTLLAVIVYLVWAAQYARIPVEVRDGWRRLLGR